MANFTTSSGCDIWYIMGLQSRMSKKRANPRPVHKTKPCFRADFPEVIFPAPSDSATKGVMAVEKPIPRDIAIKTKLLPKDTAASSAVPSCPTIILSAKATKVWPSRPKITGKDRLRLYLNSLVYCCSKVKNLRANIVFLYRRWLMFLV